jgi:hypothetical protein
LCCDVFSSLYGRCLQQVCRDFFPGRKFSRGQLQKSAGRTKMALQQARALYDRLGDDKKAKINRTIIQKVWPRLRFFESTETVMMMTDCMACGAVHRGGRRAHERHHGSSGKRKVDMGGIENQHRDHASCHTRGRCIDDACKVAIEFHHAVLGSLPMASTCAKMPCVEFCTMWLPFALQ